ncbi:MAG: SurA N-terminal domain-containing protein [Buchnera aphidicola (Kaburagia rhusicola ensigallis)]
MIKKKIQLILSNIIMLIFVIIICFSLIITKINYDPIINKKNYVITINNDKISLEEFTKLYTFALLKNKKTSHKNDLNSLYNKNYTKNIFQQVLSNIIYKTLLQQYVKKLNISINDSDVKNYIHNQSIFKIHNIFNIQKYYSFLNSANINSYEYKKKIKIDLKINKFISLISNSEFILKHEINNFIELLSQIRVIKQATINIPKTFKRLYINQKYFKNCLYKNNTINYFLVAKKIINELNTGSNELLKKIKLKFNNPQKLSKFGMSKLEKLIFNLPLPKKNNNVYFSIFKNNGNLLLIQFYKTQHTIFSKKQKNIIVSQILKHRLKMTLNSILNNLYTNANISYDKLTTFKKYL